jgi:hypothetical protein
MTRGRQNRETGARDLPLEVDDTMIDHPRGARSVALIA